jgi:hypothetical protein
VKATPNSLALKVKRAEAQTVSLDREIGRWAEIQSNSIYRDLQDNGRDHVYRVGKPEPFRDQWLVIVGEILYDLRSALDHLAHAIVPPPGTGSEFPVFHQEHGPNGFLAKAPAKLPGLQQGEPDAWDIIERLQPYKRTGKRDSLWVLHELNIIDKHRYPVARTAAPYETRFGFRLPPGVRLPEFIPAADSLDFVQDNRVATFRFADPHPEVNLQPEFALNVFFDEVASPDEPICQTLLWLARYVRTRVIAPLERFL